MLSYFYTFLIILVVSTIGFGQSDSSGTYQFNSAQQPVRDSVGTQPNQPLTIAPTGDLDSLKYEILRLRNDLTTLRGDLSNVQLNLMLSHRKYKKGALIMGAGVAAFFLGVFSPVSSTGYVSSQSILLILGGMGATVTGSIIMINSHKYIGKAGVNVRRYTRTARFRE